ncbi:MAG: cardiolipin synthase B [Deltaproteobacteria bacterium]|nr:cardiolipin synthase B [Deltaproteobacteria bacterium]
MTNSALTGLSAQALRYIEEPGGLLCNNSVRLLRNGRQAFPAWLAAIDAAQTRVSMEMYIFNDDDTGKRFADALCRAARRGVEVRLLYDSVGCRHAAAGFFGTMRQAGVLAIPYHPYRLWRPRFWTLLRRNHRKTLVCDGQVAFTGGINIADSWRPDSEGGGGWHDAAIEVRGPAVTSIEAVFLRTWNWRAKRRLRFKLSRLGRPAPVGHVPLSVIANREVVDRFSIRRAALHAIRASLSRIYLASPYFVPDAGFLRSLANAATRGVDVRLLVPKHSDTQTVDLASRATYGRLLPAGVRIFQHHSVVHTKALLVDDEFVSLGSYNLDHRSLVYNLEMVVNALDQKYNEEVADMLLADMGAGAEIRWETFRKRSLLERLLERLAYAFRHWF